MGGLSDWRSGSEMTRAKRRLRLKPLSPFLWLILSAGLFLLGAASFSGHGAKELAQFGVLGAVAAIALIVAFLY
jgi:hypothetical protein